MSTGCNCRPRRVRYLTQTTLSLDETRDIMARLKERFPLIDGPKAQDICYATENRQMAVKGVAEYCDLLLVVGSQNSSNSKRLVEVSAQYGVRAYLVNDYGEVDIAWLTAFVMWRSPLEPPRPRIWWRILLVSCGTRVFTSWKKWN